MRGRKKQPELVLIEWDDPWSHGGWIGLDEALRMCDEKDGSCRTVGWLLKETPDYVFVAGSIGNAVGPTDQVGDVFKLHRRCIDKITPLVAAP